MCVLSLDHVVHAAHHHRGLLPRESVALKMKHQFVRVEVEPPHHSRSPLLKNLAQHGDRKRQAKANGWLLVFFCSHQFVQQFVVIMEKVQNFVQEHQNYFVEKLREAVAIPR
jgi:hypothetical protein